MAQLTVSEAAKLVSRSPKTLHRLVKEGKISATNDAMGQRQIETSELIRFFGEIGQGGAKDSRTTGSTSQVETKRIELLEAELALVREQLRVKDQMIELELRHAKEVISLREEQIQDLRKTMLWIESSPRQITPEPKRSRWTWGKKT
jgi:excisionase family DNA binding protein